MCTSSLPDVSVRHKDTHPLSYQQIQETCKTHYIWLLMDPLPFIRQHLSYDGLEDIKENYQNCSVLNCV